MRTWSFTVGLDRGYRFSYDRVGGLRALPDSTGQVQVIGARRNLTEDVVSDNDWTEQKEATGNNAKISDGSELYAGADFGEPLIRGQVEDALWGLGPSLPTTGRLVELGCGPGFLLEALQQVLPGWQLVGIDPSEASVSQAAARGLDVRQGFADTANLAPGFDAVVVMGNLQLHPDIGVSLSALQKLASPGARLYVDSKNPVTTARRIAAFSAAIPGAHRVPLVQGFAAHAFHGLRSCPTQQQLTDLLERTGWSVERMRTTGPRLLRYDSNVTLAHGVKGRLWRALDQVDAFRGERAWIQVGARKT